MLVVSRCGTPATSLTVPQHRCMGSHLSSHSAACSQLVCHTMTGATLHSAHSAPLMPCTPERMERNKMSIGDCLLRLSRPVFCFASGAECWKKATLQWVHVNLPHAAQQSVIDCCSTHVPIEWACQSPGPSTRALHALCLVIAPASLSRQSPPVCWSTGNFHGAAVSQTELKSLQMEDGNAAEDAGSTEPAWHLNPNESWRHSTRRPRTIRAGKQPGRSRVLEVPSTARGRAEGLGYRLTCAPASCAFPANQQSCLDLCPQQSPKRATLRRAGQSRVTGTAGLAWLQEPETRAEEGAGLLMLMNCWRLAPV